MKITLKNIKHSAFASQETHCYEASIYVDGKKSGTVFNEGFGGEDHIDWNSKEIEDRVNAWVKVQPRMPLPWDENDTLPFSLEIMFGELVNRWLDEKELKRVLRKGLIMINNNNEKGSYSIYKIPAFYKDKKAELFHKIVDLKMVSKDAICLNILPTDKALQHFHAI